MTPEPQPVKDNASKQGTQIVQPEDIGTARQEAERVAALPAEQQRKIRDRLQRGAIH